MNSPTVSILPMLPIRVAAAQMPEGGAEPRIDVIRRLAAEAKAGGAELVVFPELSLTGYTLGAAAFRRVACSRTGALVQSAAAIAMDLNIAICVGYPEQPTAANCSSLKDSASSASSPTPPLSPHPTPSAGSSGPIFNASILIGPDGETVHHYRKTHLFGSYELDIFTPGGVGEISTSLLRPSNIRVGILICMDCEYPEPSRLLGLQGADLLILPTALGAGPVANVTPTKVVPTRALENHMHIIYSNFNGPAVGNPSEPAFIGQSAIIGPDGCDLARAPGAEAHHRGGARCSALIFATVDTEAFAVDVARNPYLTARRPELYHALSQVTATDWYREFERPCGTAINRMTQPTLKWMPGDRNTAPDSASGPHEGR